MPKYITELRTPYRGSTWAGPDIEAPSLMAARKMMEKTPYKVIGEIMMVTENNGEITRHILRNIETGETPMPPPSNLVH